MRKIAPFFASVIITLFNYLQAMEQQHRYTDSSCSFPTGSFEYPKNSNQNTNVDDLDEMMKALNLCDKNVVTSTNTSPNSPLNARQSTIQASRCQRLKTFVGNIAEILIVQCFCRNLFILISKIYHLVGKVINERELEVLIRASSNVRDQVFIDLGISTSPIDTLIATFQDEIQKKHENKELIRQHEATTFIGNIIALLKRKK